jgi:hypothetical protein
MSIVHPTKLMPPWNTHVAIMAFQGLAAAKWAWH